MARLKFKAAVTLAAQNPNARAMFEALGGQLDIQKLSSVDADRARPFVSQIAWALFSAYRTIVGVAVTKLQVLKAGFDTPNILDEDAIRRLITVALPHQAEYVAKYDSGACYYLLEELESRLLEELRNMMQGIESDKATIEQAAVILTESERVMTSISKPAST
jgi:hypothetical protein